jgi:uncharacterized protein YigA (DUF484 family)
MEKGETLQFGTPLDQLPTITASQVLELRALKIETVEQLSNMPDNTVQLLGTGGQELKQRAIRFLDRAASNEQLSEQVRALQRELVELRQKSDLAAAAAAAKSTVAVTTAAQLKA